MAVHTVWLVVVSPPVYTTRLVVHVVPEGQALPRRLFALQRPMTPLVVQLATATLPLRQVVLEGEPPVTVNVEQTKAAVLLHEKVVVSGEQAMVMRTANSAKARDIMSDFLCIFGLRMISVVALRARPIRGRSRRR